MDFRSSWIMKALCIKNLKKTYSNGFEALKGIDLTVDSGDFYSLLGPNGAGKTTAIGIICSLNNKTDGSITVFGKDIQKNLEMSRKSDISEMIRKPPKKIQYLFLKIFEKLKNSKKTKHQYFSVNSTIGNWTTKW